MSGIITDYFFQVDDGKRFFYLKIMEMKCDISQFCNIFTEIGESLINTSFENVCIDLSSMPLVTSMVFGVCVNIATLAKQLKKKLKFKFNEDALETARLSSFDHFVEIEKG
jgi:hypothetical protein